MPQPPARSQIWVVDDSRLDGERARKALAGVHDVELYADGATVLERLSSTVGPPPDLIVLDWVMPGVSGLDVCRHLSTRPTRPGLILATALRSDEQAGEAFVAGADDYLAKPFAEAELRARVDAVLRKRAALARAESAEDLLRRVLGSTPDPLIVVDVNDRVQFASAEAIRAFAPGGADLVGVELARVAPELFGARALADGTMHPLPDVVRGGRVFSPIVRRQADHLVLSLRDVTEIRRGDVRRLDLYSIVAHDLRTPLSSMLLRAEALMRGARGPLPPQAVADLERMQGNMRSLVELINDFLDLARLEGTGFALQPERVDLAEVAHRTMEDFQPLLRASELTWRDEREGGPADVVGDPRRLLQVIANLVANAIKFTPPGGTITTRVVATPADVAVHVQDTGRGIAAEAIPQLFQRYQRTIDAEHQVAGTGLGLLIVREIIEAHGGTVGVDSTPGVGSTFWFRVPRPRRADAGPRHGSAEEAAE